MYKTKMVFLLKFLSSIITLIILNAVGNINTQSPWPEKLIVAQDGTGNFSLIQAAVNATRDFSQVQVEIFIKSGIYREKLVIPSWKTKIHLIGENKLTTIITNDDFSGKPWPNSGYDPTGSGFFNTFTSYTVLVHGDEFQATELTIRNTAGPNVSQAVALHVEGDRAIFKDCNILANQDTIYTARGRHYFRDCYIEGTTDFIFGGSTAVFDRCLIKSLKNSYITAASTPPEKDFGFVFRNCSLVADPSLNVTRVYLGRPWRPYAKTVFINTKMERHIVPAGWDNWGNPENEATTYYGEFESEGVDVSERVSWSHQLTNEEAAQYTLDFIFAARDDWVVLPRDHH